jgi:hypothetical protein
VEAAGDEGAGWLSPFCCGSAGIEASLALAVGGGEDEGIAKLLLPGCGESLALGTLGEGGIGGKLRIFLSKRLSGEEDL